jgi:enoyl-CoA hydratase/carnithine racemase
MDLSSASLDAAKALKIGLVSNVLPKEQLMAEAIAMAKTDFRYRFAF